MKPRSHHVALVESHTNSAAELAHAFHSCQGARQALRVEDLKTINLDIPAACIVVLGALPAINPMAKQLAKLPDFDVAQFSELRTFTLAALHAHLVYAAAAGPTADLPTLNARALVLRASLLIAANALGDRKLIDPSRLADLSGATGYRNVAVDVMAIARLLLDAWEVIENKTAVEKPELVDAMNIGMEMLSAIGRRDANSQTPTVESDDRNRAFTLFAKAYDSARSGVAYLRAKQGDAEEIAPSIYAGRGAGVSSTPSPPPVTPSSVPPPAAPVVAATSEESATRSVHP